MKTKAFRFYKPETIQLEEIDIPEPQEGELIVKNKVALTCGTDVKMYLRGYPLFTPPFLFGHEAAGFVAKIGKGVENFKEGDPICFHNTAPCHRCYFCKKGQHSMCDSLELNQGAFAEYMRLPAGIVAENAFPVPTELDFESAALMEPFSTAVYGSSQIGIQLGDTVAIIGAGPLGLMHNVLAKARGARVIICDMSAFRLNVAVKLGADVTVQVSEDTDLYQAVIEHTEEERGADVVIEAVGQPTLWEKAVSLARKGGRVLWFGGTKGGSTVTLDTKTIHYSQLTLKGIFHTTPEHVKIAYDLIKMGLINSKNFVYNQYSLERLESAILEHKSGKVIKNAIYFD